jgi:hypothetical protein
MIAYSHFGQASRLMAALCLLAVPVTGAASNPLVNLAKVVEGDNSIVSEFGYSVAISGQTAITGAPTSNAAYVFVQLDGVWVQQAQLAPTDFTKGDGFGYAVAIDGDTALVGSPGNNGSSGAVYVFTRSNQSWSLQAKLVPPTSDVQGAFGHSVALSGNLAAIGAPYLGNLYQNTLQTFSGAVFMFSRKASVWKQDARLTEPDPGPGDQFGSCVAIGGSTALACAADRKMQEGAIGGSVFALVSLTGNWAIQAEIAAPVDQFGQSAALDGNNALIGAEAAAYLYTRSTSQTWDQKAVLSPGGVNTTSGLVNSVALSGTTAVLGLPYDDTTGTVRVFDGSSGNWIEQTELTAPDGTFRDQFGYSVALGQSILAGAPLSDNEVGAFYEIGPQPSNVVLLSSPPGRFFTLSGSGCGTPGTFIAPYSGNWTQCTVQWVSPDSPANGVRYTFHSWEDAGAVNPRTIVPPLWQTTYTADFTTEYQLTTAAVPVSGGTVTGAGWYPAGTGTIVTAIANPGFLFTGFINGLGGFQTPQVIPMSGPVTVTGGFVPTPPAVMTGSITAKSGVVSQRLWTISVTNSGPGIAYGAQLFMLTFQQTFGTACTVLPVRLSPAAFPVAVGTMNAGTTAQSQTLLDFSGCPANARFTVNLGYMSNGGSSGGVIQLVNQVQ